MSGAQDKNKPRQSRKPTTKTRARRTSSSLTAIRIEQSALQLTAQEELSLPEGMVPAADRTTRGPWEQ